MHMCVGCAPERHCFEKVPSAPVGNRGECRSLLSEMHDSEVPGTNGTVVGYLREAMQNQ